MARKIKALGKQGKMILPGRLMPHRRHYCSTHDIVMTPVKEFGKSKIIFECKEGCRLNKRHTVLK